MVTALVSTALTNLAGPPVVHICKQSLIILVVEPDFAGEQSALVDVQSSLIGLAIASMDAYRKTLGVASPNFF